MRIASTLGVAFALTLAAHCGVASAAQQRSFVSTQGNDAAACTLGAPCRSFAAAIAQTLSSGEIIVLDSGGYGPVVVNKSVELIAPPGVYAGITAGAGTGIQVVSPAGRVALRGIAINGLGTGQFGIDVQSTTEVIVERCRVENFVQDGMRTISEAPVAVRDTEIRANANNGITASGGPIVIESTSSVANGNNGYDFSGLFTHATLLDSTAQRNVSDGARAAGPTTMEITGGDYSNNNTSGIFVDGSIASALTIVAVDRATVAGNQQAGVFYSASASGATVEVSVSRSLLQLNFSGVVGGVSGNGLAAHAFVSGNVFTHNTQAGISVAGGGAVMSASSNVITGSAQGMSQFSGGMLFTRQNNDVRDNTANTQGTPFTNFGGL